MTSGGRNRTLERLDWVRRARKRVERDVLPEYYFSFSGMSVNEKNAPLQAKRMERSKSALSKVLVEYASDGNAKYGLRRYTPARRVCGERRREEGGSLGVIAERAL